MTCSGLQSRYVCQQGPDLYCVPPHRETWSRLGLYQADWLFASSGFPVVQDRENLQVCGTGGRASPVIFSIGLTVDQAYSQFLFREEASPNLPLICIYDICRHVEQVCIISSWSSALTLSLSWIDCPPLPKLFSKEPFAFHYRHACLYCCAFWDVRNPRHTSHSDSRPHITLRMKTARQVAEQSGQTVHVYYNEQTKQYEAFRLYSERKDDSKKDEPKDEWIQRRSIMYFVVEQDPL